MNLKLSLSLGIAACLLTCAAASGTAATPDAADPVRQLIRGLVDQNGRAVDPGRFGGRYVLVNFIFTTCGSTCPTQTSDLARFDRELPTAIRQRVTLLSISVDPTHDTPTAMKAYANMFDADTRRWTFATGNPARIAQIMRQFGAFRPGRDSVAFHTGDVRLFDAHHRLIQRYAGAPLAGKRLREDLMALAGPAG